MSWSGAAKLFTGPGGSSSGSGKCGSCAAKDAEIERQAREIRDLQAHIMNAKALAAREENKGKAGQLLNNPPIRQGMFEGMQKTARKIKNIL